MNAIPSAGHTQARVQDAASDVALAALRRGAALLRRPDAGVLLLSDNDRADFLHRMTTNDVNRLQPGQATVTVVTSPTARSLFVFSVLTRSDDLLLLPMPGRAQALAKHLRGQIFFMDAVKVQDASQEFVRARLMGPQGAQIATAIGLDLQAVEDDTWIETHGVIALRQEKFDVPGIELVIPTAQADATIAALAAAGAHELNSADAVHVRRVELGRPAAGSEINDAYNPLESGLAWACADSKGCYTGQEIIARQITYDKVTRSLVGLRADQQLAVGSDVVVDGRVAGTVTSAAYSPHLQQFLGLAIVKRPSNTAGTVVVVDGVVATVADLPFETQD